MDIQRLKSKVEQLQMQAEYFENPGDLKQKRAGVPSGIGSSYKGYGLSPIPSSTKVIAGKSGSVRASVDGAERLVNKQVDLKISRKTEESEIGSRGGAADEYSALDTKPASRTNSIDRTTP